MKEDLQVPSACFDPPLRSTYPATPRSSRWALLLTRLEVVLMAQVATLAIRGFRYYPGTARARPIARAKRGQVYKLLLTVVVIDQIIYLPSLAQVDSCPRSRKYAHRRTRVVWPATYN